MIRILLRLATATALAAIVPGCSSAPPPSPKQMEYCAKLYGPWFRYEQHPTFHHTGQRARAELALYDCQKGNYDPGIKELQTLLRRGGHAIPPAPPP